MDALQLKEYIIEKDAVPLILEKLNCGHIKKHKHEYRCALPEKRDGTAICIKIDSLKTKIYAKDSARRGDIITLTMELSDCSFVQALKHLHNILGLKFTKISNIKKLEEKYDPLAVFKKAKNKNSNSDMELKIYDESILKKYIRCPNIWFFRDGISLKSQEKFNVGFCPEQSRIVIPHRFWSGDDNDYIGIMGRTIIPEYELLNIAKYFPLLPFPKSLNLYGLQENYKSIQDTGIIIVFEGEKSVMKMDTWGYNTAVALCGKEITEEQQKILVGLNVEICFAFDVGIPEEYVRQCCDRFKHLRNVSYIFDRDDLLEYKMSPVDKKKRTFDYLFKNRTKINNIDIKVSDVDNSEVL